MQRRASARSRRASQARAGMRCSVGRPAASSGAQRRLTAAVAVAPSSPRAATPPPRVAERSATVARVRQPRHHQLEQAGACPVRTSSEPLSTRLAPTGRPSAASFSSATGAPPRPRRARRARRPGGAMRRCMHVQLDEHLDLGAQHLRHHRRQDVVDRAERVAARGLHLVGVGGDEDDRRVRRALVLADQRGGLEAVDVGHVDVEQDHRELALQHLAQRLGARAHAAPGSGPAPRARSRRRAASPAGRRRSGCRPSSPSARRRGSSSSRAQRHSQPRSTASRCIGSTGLDR